MSDEPCEYYDKTAHINPGPGKENVILTFSHLCSAKVQCRHLDVKGNPVGNDKFAYKAGDFVQFDLDPNERVAVFCGGGGGPCSFTVKSTAKIARG